LITSAGIYGFLSSAYEATASKNIVVEKQIAALESKKVRYLDTRDSYSKEKVELSKSTSELRQALSTGTMTQYKDKETGQIINVANTGNRKAFEKQLEKTLKKDSILDSKIGVLNDSIFSLESQVLDSQSKAETSGELGPLKYISKLTGVPMDKIINWFIIKPRYIDGELIPNQWFWLGAWIVYEPDEGSDPCQTYEIIYSKWRLLIGWYKKKFFWQALFKFYPYRIESKFK